MTDEIKVTLVSNRGPVTFVRSQDGFGVKRGAGGLAGALDPVAHRLGDRATWIAAATSADDREALIAGHAGSLRSLLGYPVELVDIDPATYRAYYDGVSNRMLWFANHCLWDEVGLDGFGVAELEAWNRAYIPVNAMFARVAARHSEADSLVLFQDYHLSLAPRLLRDLAPDRTISHFTHSSFCGRAGLEPLPDPIPERVIDGMLGADLVGFHVPAWADGFLDCCDLIGAQVDRTQGTVIHDGRKSWIRTYPIPIDATQLRERSERAEVVEWEARFGEAWTHGEPGEGHLVVRADRAEPSKNIVRGFEAFGLLLDRRPDLRETTRFIACIYPSRQSMPEYRTYTERILHTVDVVNARHPGSIQLHVQDEFDRTLGALRIYDVLLVNPIMDGMNLVSKEGPAINQRNGVLVLSQGAGSFTELGDHSVEIADPLDLEATAQALERALDMRPTERTTRAEALRAAAQARKPEDWIEAQLGDLAAIQRGGDPVTPPPG